MSDEHADGVAQSSVVDWVALWEEFGFDTPNPIGVTYASETQLTAAIQASKRPIDGSPKTLIDQAVEDGDLIRLTAADEYGTQITRGYALNGGGASA